MYTFPFNEEANSINPRKTVNIDIQYSIIIKFIKSLYNVNLLPFTRILNTWKETCESFYPFMCTKSDEKGYKKNSKKYAKQIPAFEWYTLFTPCLELSSRWVQITFTFKVIWWSPTIDALQMRVKQNKKKHCSSPGTAIKEVLIRIKCFSLALVLKQFASNNRVQESKFEKFWHWTRFKFIKSRRLLFKCSNSKNKFAQIFIQFRKYFQDVLCRGMLAFKVKFSSISAQIWFYCWFSVQKNEEMINIWRKKYKCIKLKAIDWNYASESH